MDVSTPPILIQLSETMFNLPAGHKRLGLVLGCVTTKDGRDFVHLHCFFDQSHQADVVCKMIAAQCITEMTKKLGIDESIRRVITTAKEFSS